MGVTFSILLFSFVYVCECWVSQNRFMGLLLYTDHMVYFLIRLLSENVGCVKTIYFLIIIKFFKIGYM